MRALVAVLLLSGCTELSLEPYAPLSEVEVGPKNEMALTGEPFPMTVTAYDADGRNVPIPGWTPVHWSVDDPSVTVYGGEVIGSRGAVARVTASVAGLSDGAVIRINPAILDVELTIAISQAVQDPFKNIPLIAGRDAIFRAFITSGEVNFYDAIDIRATIKAGVDSFILPVISLGRTDQGIPKRVTDTFDEGYFHEVAIAGSWFGHGTVLEIELDPEGKLDPRLGFSPASFQVQLPVTDVPVHKQMIVPTLTARGSTSGIIELTESIASDSIMLLKSIFPINELEVEVHEIFRSDTDLCRTERGDDGGLYPTGWFQFINEIDAMRLAEGRKGWHYLGLVTASYVYPETGKCPQGSLRLGGIAARPGFTATAIPPRWAMIHEVGHNFNLGHAPCAYGGIGGLDPEFPHEYGEIGNWGFDILNEAVYSPDIATDIMGYCFLGDQWISAYHFDKARRWRLGLDGQLGSVGGGDAMLVWGTATPTGIDLEPSFRLDTEYVLASGEGSHVLTVVGPDETLTYQSRFTPTALSEGEGSAFGFAIPYTGEVNRIEVFGPEGRDELGRGTEAPVAIWWQGNEVVRVQRVWSSDNMAHALAAGTRVMISEGVPR